jgi:Probable sensor domain DACNV
MTDLANSSIRPTSDRLTRNPRDLAETVHSELRSRSIPCPEIEVLIELFEAMYFASLKREESQPVAFHIVYLNPDKPDPKPPTFPPHDRWSCVPLAKAVPLSEKNFMKMAGASDPRTSSFAVYSDAKGRLVVWGLIDQGNRYHDFLNFESDTRPERPGLFQASITGVGQLVAYIGYKKIAELRLNVLVRRALDVLKGGAIHEALRPGIDSYRRAVRRGLAEFLGESRWDQAAYSPESASWLSAIRRLLLRVQNIRHGGAFLITPEEAPRGLSIKHEMTYERLRSNLERFAIVQAKIEIMNDHVRDEYMEKDADDIPLFLHVDLSITGYDLEEIRNELEGAIWFISLLTRVDGLVLLSPTLVVRGFGVEITTQEKPPEVFIAGDIHATEAKLREVDYQLYGTRHRSMMRYCSSIPGSIGFVISQDGDVRVMTKVNKRLVVWENIRLQYPAFVRSKKRRGR